jgi:haloalkane dehalogenase
MATSSVDPSLYPFSPCSFETPDGRISYVDEGNGRDRPVFLVHGTPSWSFEWRSVIRALAPTRRVIAPDHLGFGLSDKPETAPYRPADHARRLLALFDSLDLHDVTLVVHDFGGPIGLPIALERRSRVSRLVVLNSFMWPPGSDPKAARIGRLIRSFVGRFFYLSLNASPRWILPASFGDKRKLTPAMHRMYLAPFLGRRARTAPWALGCELTGASDPYYEELWEGRSRLRDLPTTIVWGGRDPAFGEAHLERWIQAIPAATVVRCPDAGHFPQEEDPERVIGAISDV